MLLVFLRGGLFYSLPLRGQGRSSCPVKASTMAQGQHNRRLARWKSHVDLCRVDLVFRMSRAFLLARLPLYCSADCATPTNTSLFVNFPRNLANAPLPPESFHTCFVCATHAHSAFPLLPAALATVLFRFVLARVYLPIPEVHFSSCHSLLS